MATATMHTFSLRYDTTHIKNSSINLEYNGRVQQFWSNGMAVKPHRIV